MPLYIPNVKDEVKGPDTNKLIKSSETTVLTKQDIVSLDSILRPGMTISDYVIEIDPDINSGTFQGRLIASVHVNQDTREEPLKFFIEELDIDSAEYAIGTAGSNFQEADFNTEEDHVEISTGLSSLSYTIIINYEGPIRNDGTGLYIGHYGDS